MPVDVTTEIEINRPRSEVAAYASDPDNATAWYQHIKAVEWRTARPAAVGSRITFAAQFLGRRLDYTYEVREIAAGEQFVMRTAEGPFPMETTYIWRDTASGGTLMRLCNRVSRQDSPGSLPPSWPAPCAGRTRRTSPA